MRMHFVHQKKPQQQQNNDFIQHLVMGNVGHCLSIHLDSTNGLGLTPFLSWETCMAIKYLTGGTQISFSEFGPYVLIRESGVMFEKT